MLLVVDIGNTSITVGVFKGKRLIATWRHPSNGGISAKKLEKDLLREAKRSRVRISAAVFGSVVPRLDKKIAEAIRKAFGVLPIQVGPESALGLSVRVKHPKEVGADRVLNALAAKKIYGLPAIVIDFGTATTFDCVSRKGEYLGGAILPGPKIMAESLKEKTAKLPLVEIQKPKRAIGKDTIECIEAGLYFGYLGMIENLLKLSLSEMGVLAGETSILATGGLSWLFRRELPKGCAFAPDLTLEGLRVAWEKLK